jgi:outer membrane autotransporter protein
MRDRSADLVATCKSCMLTSMYANFSWRLGLPLLAAIMLIWAGLLPANAQTTSSPSTGCSAANGGLFDRNISSGSNQVFNFAFGAGFDFAAGEILTISYSVSLGGSPSATSIISLIHDQTGQTLLSASLTTAQSSISTMFTISVNGANTFSYTSNIPAETSADLVVRCTVFAQVIDNTPTITQVFLDRRIQLLITEEPDRPRLVRRQPGVLYGDGSGVNMTATANAYGGSRLEFASSLGSIAQAFAYADEQKLNSAGVGQNVNSAPARTGIDIWVEGHYTFYENDVPNASSDGEFGVIYFGADTLLSPDLMVGALVQYDWITDQSNILGTRVNGRGWMAGPYLSARIRPNLYLDVRAAWGQSDNSLRTRTITTATFPLGGTTVTTGVGTANYDTDRWLVRGNLTGNWQRGDWRFTPSVSAVYLEERQEAFTTSIGTLVAGRTYQAGRVTFGPEVAHRSITASGTTVEPHVALTGIWDFIDNGNMVVGQTIVAPDEFHARVEGGVLITAVSGRAVRLTGSYDGIGGGGFHSYGAQLWVNIPLN